MSRTTVSEQSATADASAAANRVATVLAVLSMLHEPSVGSAVRLFRGRPVLRWALERLSRCEGLSAAVILCWDDQAEAAAEAAGADALVLAKGPRNPPAALQAVAAARRWADGWRGGLMGTCAFDIGFHGPWARDAAALAKADAVVLIDPAAGLVDAALIDRLIAHAAEHTDTELCFLPAAPGLGAALLRAPLLDRLSAGTGIGNHPGRLLHYYPTQVSREMLASDACAPTPTPVARTLHSFALSSDRQVRRMEAATQALNGQLSCADAAQIVDCVSRYHLSGSGGTVDGLPREVVLELNTRRASRPIFWPGRYHPIQRPDLSLDLARVLFNEMSQLDDSRLTLAGVGDPMLADGVFEIIAAARAAGLAVHVETDLLGVSPQAVRELARGGADVISIHLPATTVEIYETVMGVDEYRQALANIEIFVRERAALQKAVPLLAPLFVKCSANVAQMEPWYDQWLAALGSAVIIGPGDFAGLVPNIAVADMAPPRRRPCTRLASRVTVLSDGNIVSCEQDVLGRGAVGQIGIDRLTDIWRQQFGTLRFLHSQQAWSQRPLCAGCREWHRP